MRALVDQFAALAEFPTAQPRPADLNTIVENSLALVAGRRQSIRLVKRLAPGLPLGLAIIPTTGVISGTPGGTGTYNVAVTAVNASGSYPKTAIILALAFSPAGVGHHNAILPDFVPWELTIVSYAFLHANWLHIIGNMAFLWVFGDDVEQALPATPLIRDPAFGVSKRVGPKRKPVVAPDDDARTSLAPQSADQDAGAVAA